MIITSVKDSTQLGFSYLNNYPDPFVSEKKKLTDESYIKNTMDYYANMAYTQYRRNKERYEPNYNLLKGILTRKDFWQDDVGVVDDWLTTLEKHEPLPAHVKHYSLMNQPVNALVGESSKRPDIRKVKAFDDRSQAEELEYKTAITQQLILQGARQMIFNKLALQGVDVSKIAEEEMDNLTFESVKEQITDYTSQAEKWGNMILTALKVRFNLKGKSEECFRDLLVCAHEFFHIYEDNSKLGFNVRAENPKNVWFKGTPDLQYTSTVSGDSLSAYCGGTVYVQEISEIINDVPELTIEEIEHLKKGMQNSILLTGRESNLFTGQTGAQTIHYDTYDPLVWQERMILQSEIGSENNGDDLNRWVGGPNAFSFGYKYVVVRAYFNSKKKIGNLTYMDAMGIPQNRLVDETYIEGSPGEISIEWAYVNQWYRALKIGPDIYHISPFKLLDYFPIIGLVHEQKNTSPISLVDLMKPLQVLFNVVMNQLYELFEKEIGNVGVVNIRRIPKPKDADAQDVIDIWVQQARERGMVIDDDSPENTKGPMQNTTIANKIDLTRTNEIQSRINVAMQLQEMAWQLVGMNKQRMGQALATETATANQNALVQSFAQTETYFAAHGYLLDQLYQAILDAAKYVESHNPMSTINFINSQGGSSFIQVMGDDIAFRDLWVMPTSRPEDQELFNEFRQLSQAALQNGASLYEVSLLFSTNSIREQQRMLKELKDRLDEYQQREQEIKQQGLQIQNEEAKARIEQEQRFHDDEMFLRKYEADLKSTTDITKAEIGTYFQAPTTDADGDGTPDIMELANHQLDVQNSLSDHQLKKDNLNLQYMKFQEEQRSKKVNEKQQERKLNQEDEKIKIAKRKPPTPKKSKK